jgi:hypothetical protein
MRATATAGTFVWLGMVLAASFLETPLKFRAAGVDLRTGLAIGRLVFSALNTAEIVLARSCDHLPCNRGPNRHGSRADAASSSCSSSCSWSAHLSSDAPTGFSLAPSCSAPHGDHVYIALEVEKRALCSPPASSCSHQHDERLGREIARAQ